LTIPQEKHSVTSVLLVGLGGFIGAAFRYLVILSAARLMPDSSFPWGVMAVNVTGSFIIGLLAGLAESREWTSPELRLFLFAGILGGFTTFSSITNDTLALLRAANYLGALTNVGGTFTL